jgi:hypothetical protein
MALSFDPDAAGVAGTCRGPSRAVEMGTRARPTTSASSGPPLARRAADLPFNVVRLRRTALRYFGIEPLCCTWVKRLARISRMSPTLLCCTERFVGGSASTARVAPVAGAAVARPGEVPALSSSQRGPPRGLAPMPATHGCSPRLAKTAARPASERRESDPPARSPSSWKCRLQRAECCRDNTRRRGPITALCASTSSSSQLRNEAFAAFGPSPINPARFGEVSPGPQSAVPRGDHRGGAEADRVGAVEDRGFRCVGIKTIRV